MSSGSGCEPGNPSGAECRPDHCSAGGSGPSSSCSLNVVGGTIVNGPIGSGPVEDCSGGTERSAGGSASRGGAVGGAAGAGATTGLAALGAALGAGLNEGTAG